MSAFPREKTRAPAVAGRFYPEAPDRLQAEVSRAVERGARRLSRGPVPPRPVRALIVPHAGYVYSGEIAGAGYALLARDAARIRRVVVLAPSHRVALDGISVGAWAAFATPLGEIPVDVQACRRLLARTPRITDTAAPHRAEHALEVQLPFIQTVLSPETRLVPMVCGDLDLGEMRRLAPILREELWDDATAWILSSDFTHYGRPFRYLPFLDRVKERLEELDNGAIRCIQARAPEQFLEYIRDTGATICGRVPIALFLTLLENQPNCRVTPLAYTTSGDLTGDFDASVSYAALAVLDPDLPAPENTTADDLGEPERQALLQLARQAIAASLEHRRLVVPEHVANNPRLARPGAAFVTLELHGRLRGCIGSIEAVAPLYEDVIANARNAAFHDPRFYPLSPAEFPDVEIEISVLTTPRPIDSPEEFVVGRHGIILEKHGARAVFLPQVAPEQGWNREQTLRHLALKAGLGPEDWRRGARFYVFEALVFRESPAKN